MSNFHNQTSASSTMTEMASDLGRQEATIQSTTAVDVEKASTTLQAPTSAVEWNGPNDPDNPLLWSKAKRTYHFIPPALISFSATLGSSIYSPAIPAIMERFGVSSTVAILPLTLYVFALGFGPTIAAPMSETYGRRITYLVSPPLGALFTVGAGFSGNIWTLCILRFFAGLTFSPALAIGAGTIADTHTAVERAIPSGLFITTPFLGPALGPVLGSFVTVRKDWRWTQWTLIFFAIASFISALFTQETYKKTILLRRAKRLSIPIPAGPPVAERIKFLLTITLARPLNMLFTEPIVAFLSIYTAFNFSVLFAFFAAFPYVFRSQYDFSIEQSGLVFLAIGVGCFLALFTVVVCDRVFYQPQVRASLAKGNDGAVAPEYRLYPALFGCFGMPISLFWFAWTARRDISWASPVIAAIPFGWANLAIFIGTATYLVDTYQALNSASAIAANGILRYMMGAVFPLFTLQMYKALGIDWATSLLGFISIALIPVPWVLFKWGPIIRSKSGYETLKA